MKGPTRSHSSFSIPPGAIDPATWIVIPQGRLFFTGVVTGVAPAALLVFGLPCWVCWDSPSSGAGGGGRNVWLSCALGGFPPGRVVLLSPQSACMAGE